MLFIFSLCLIITVVFSRLFYKLIWRPTRVQFTLAKQGLNGPSYKFIHGNTKQILKMRRDAITTPYDLSQHDLFPRILPHLNTWIKLYGSNFVTWIGHQPQIVVTEPELVKEILTNKDGVYKKTKAEGHLKRLLGDGLVKAEGEKWSRLRKLANHAFHGESLKDMFPAMVESVEIMVDGWMGKREIEISNEFKVLTSDVISRTAFGSSYVEGKNIFEMMTKLGVLVSKSDFKIRFFGLEKIWRTKGEIESDEMERSLRDSILSLVNKRKEKVKTGESDTFGNDYLGSLLKAHHDLDPKNTISEDEIVDEFKVFYIAGHATLSNLLSWTALLLSTHKDWQENARQEVLQLFGTQKPTPEGIARLKILTMIVNEALRLYAPIVYLTRIVERRTNLGRYDIPENVEVIIPLLALHLNKETWGEDAHLFNPERFDKGLAKAANGNSVGFLPFGGGARACVGSNFAVKEAKITLTMILQRYVLSLSPEYVHSPFQLLVVTPQHGIQIILQSL